MAITDCPSSEHPRENLLEQGAAALSDAELLAIILRKGVVGKSAVDLARDLLTIFGSLNEIFSATEHELSQVHGICSSKYVQLQAIYEMSRRALNEELEQRDVYQSPKQGRDYLILKLGALTREVFMLMFLDAKNRLNATEQMFSGTLTQQAFIHGRWLNALCIIMLPALFLCIIIHLVLQNKALQMSY